MIHRKCVTASSVHLLALAVSTYIAAKDIESILYTGWICSFTGFVTGLTALQCKRRWLAAAGFFTPALALCLLTLEAVFWNLGPTKAAVPFNNTFLVHQCCATIIILVELNLMLADNGASTRQIALKTLLAATLALAIFFGIARRLLQREHSIQMGLALALFGLTFTGLFMTLYAAGRRVNHAGAKS